MRSRAIFLLIIGAGASAPVQAQDAQVQLWEAAISGDTTALRGALTAGAKVDSLDTRRSANGRRALNWAALNNQVPAIRLLLAAGAKIDTANRTGFTALHHAAEAGSLEAATELLKAGANPKLTNLAGVTPAQVARERGFASVAALLEAAEQGKRP
ncbi:MAG TPA: ankyrin repeat domain-containing protein [Gemmatimonadales bacterium]